jgi:hypothetical protein
MNANDELIHSLAEFDRMKKHARKHEDRNKETTRCLAEVRTLLVEGYPNAALARVDALYALREDRARVIAKRVSP